MTASLKIKLAAVFTAVLSLLLGVATLLWADFGMPGWFFIFTQIWFWTIGLPTMAAVLLITTLWGIPGWTALPLWIYVPCAALVAMAFQYAGFLLASRLWHRIVGRHP